MKHGANIYKYAADLGCKSDEIIDFSSNINLYNPKLKLKPTNSMVVKYPDAKYKNLKDAISKKYGVKNLQMALFNGATTAIFELFKILEEKRVYLYAPLYGEYEKAIPKSKKIIKINRFKNINEKVKKHSIVVFVNPSTPDGKFYKLKKLFDYWKEKNCSIILDESFLEFEELNSFRDEINSYEKLYILQSFSKFNACAGVRIGAIFSNKKNIKKFELPLWNLSSFDEQFLTQRLKDLEFKKQTHKLHKKRKKELYEILNSCDIFEKVYESDANFFLVRTKKAKEIFEFLINNMVLVRTCGSFDFLDNNYLRFAVKTKKAHKLLKKLLNDDSLK